MKDCVKYQQLVSCYVDGIISQEDKDALEAHVVSCSSCAFLLKIYKDVFSGPADLSDVPPEALVSGVMNRVKRFDKSGGTDKAAPSSSSKKNIIFRQIMSYAAAAACIVLVLFAVPKLLNLGAASDENSESVSDSAQENLYSVSYDLGSDLKAATGETQSDATATPEVTTSDSAVATGDDTSAEVFYATVTITGALPDILADHPQTDIGNGSYYIYIDADMLNSLIELGYTADYTGAEDTAAPIVVIYTP